MSTQYGFALVPPLETVTWTTTEDWDAATSETTVDHDADEVALARRLDHAFESDPAGTNPPTGWTQYGGPAAASMTVTAASAAEGTQSAAITNPDGTSGNAYTATYAGDPATDPPTYFRALCMVDESRMGRLNLVSAADTAGPYVSFGESSSNPGQITYYDGAFRPVRPFTVGEWFEVEMRNIDWTAETYDLYIDGVLEQANARFHSAYPANAGSGGAIHAGINATFSTVNYHLDGVQGDYHRTGTLTSASKSNADAFQPNLSGLAYSLNGGGITLRVVGSPGQPGEETVTRVLDGASAYPLSWAASHSNFRIEADLSGPGGNVTPTLSGVTLTSAPAAGTPSWAGAADWDAATTESAVEHSSVGGRDPATVRLGTLASDGDLSRWTLIDEGTGPVPLTTHEVVTTDAAVGPAARRIVGNNTMDMYSTLQLDVPPSTTEIAWWLKWPTAPSTGEWAFSPRFFAPEGKIASIAYDAGSANGTNSIIHRPGMNWTSTGQSIPGGTWFRTRVAFDFAANSYTLHYKPLGGTETQIGSGPFTDNTVASAVSHTWEHWTHNTGALEAYHEYDTLYTSAGTLTTAPESSGVPQQPSLSNLDYRLNGGGITLRVVGSPGTAQSETVTQALDGASAYPLTWAASHSNFRIEADLSTADAATTPTLSGVTLDG